MGEPREENPVEPEPEGDAKEEIEPRPDGDQETPDDTESERRSRERHKIAVIGVVLFQARNSRGAARVINVSLGGVLLESEFTWPAIGADVVLSFSIEQHGLIFSVQGRIVRLVGDNQAAVQFHEESEKLRAVIEKALGV